MVKPPPNGKLLNPLAYLDPTPRVRLTIWLALCGTSTISCAPITTQSGSFTSPPALQQLQLMPANPQTTDRLWVKNGDGGKLMRTSRRFNYRWFVNGGQVSTEETLDPKLFVKGDEITVLLNPYDGRPTIEVAGSQESSTRVSRSSNKQVTSPSPKSVLPVSTSRNSPPKRLQTTIINTSPELGEVVFSPNRPHTDDRLLAWVTVTDADDDPIDIRYSWTVNGEPISHKGLNLSGELFFDKGDKIELMVKIDDGEEVIRAGPYTDTILDHPPGPVGLATLPAEPKPGLDDLVCTITAESVDPDGDELSYRFSWELDGAPYLGSTKTTNYSQDTIPASAIEAGQGWVCKATPNDGYQDGTESSSYRPELSGPPNLLVILVDDLGVDLLNVYGQHPAPPPTPNIDQLAEDGILFRRAYAQPLCSPSRASLLTGRHIRRYGMGGVVSANCTEKPHELPVDEVTIPETLASAGYTSAAIGKWHLSNTASTTGFKLINTQGFDFASGTYGWNCGTDYYFWDHHINGVLQGQRTEYLTTFEIDEALKQSNSLPEPWFIYLAVHAIHGPWDLAPDELHQYDVDKNSPLWERAEAKLEALDTEIGRLLANMNPEVLERTTIVFAGDNGSSNKIIPPPMNQTGEWVEQDKGTVYERGVHVPLIIVGPTVSQPGGESHALVHLMDILPTVAALADVDPASVPGAKPLDGVDLSDYLSDVSTPSKRTYVFSEILMPVGPPPYTKENYTVRNERYKLVERNGHEELYDLVRTIDIRENNLLRNPLPPNAQAAYNELRAKLDEIVNTIHYEY
jgi:arylsulfatase A-like enzyme